MSKKIIIGYGLPGSGKTTLLCNIKNRMNESTFIDVDAYTRTAIRKKTSVEDVLKDALSTSRFFKTIFIDGLFTTNKDLEKIINLAQEVFKENLNISIQYFNEDRDACLWNDKNRRKEDCITTIKTLKYEKPDKKYILEATGCDVKLVLNTVKRKEKYKHDLDEVGYEAYDGYLKSDSWSKGGMHCDCWGNTYEVYEEDPVEFKEFDALLAYLKPDLTFLQYKKLFSSCVYTDYYYDSDYYGGSVTYEFYKCNLKDLYEELEKL